VFDKEQEDEKAFQKAKPILKDVFSLAENIF